MHRPLRKLLVANRGEIAVRLQRTARARGLATVAVFSDADADAPHVRMADQAVRLGPAPAAESYLRIDRLIEAARRTGADAVHPGFGFLAENAAFAAACRDAGLTFVGPSPEAIAAMGSKREAKRIAESAGVPVVPGYRGDDQSVARLTEEATRIGQWSPSPSSTGSQGFPVLIKASAGGGGKGMRIARSPEGLAALIEGAAREALSSFGDDSLLLERYIERPRHVEIQILGDHHGNVVHLFERECSIQRRHQKIVEESPSPFLGPELRARMGEAAVAVARAVGYASAGTVEFIVAPDGAFYFLEVNTRLQVEHPVTECVTGLDIVAEQLRIAAGEPLGYTQAELAQRGHAIEVRLYAEDPEASFLPQSGTLLRFSVPELPGIRVDTGVESGSEVSVHYDPMIAKVIAHAPTRGEAAARLAHALGGTSVAGLTTNRAYLMAVLRHPAFLAGETHTHFVDDHGATLRAREPTAEQVSAAALAACLAGWVERRDTRVVLPGLTPGFRNNRIAPERVEFRRGEQGVVVEYQPAPAPGSGARGAARFRASVDGRAHDVTLVSASGDAVCLEIDGLRQPVEVVRDAGGGEVGAPRRTGVRWYTRTPEAEITLLEVPRFPEAEVKVAPGAAVAPMPGKVVKVLVALGEAVEVGAALLVLEAMKMEHTVRAGAAGTIVELLALEGGQVEAEQVLVIVE